VGELSRKQLIGYLALGAVVVALGALWARGGSGAGGGSAATVQLSGAGGATGGAGAASGAGGSSAARGSPDGAAGSGASSTAGGNGSTGATGTPAAAGAPGPADPTGAGVVVHVAGAVRHPGLYTLPADARVDTAIDEAGGARRTADLDAVNLAAKVTDGRQILVPVKPRAGRGAGASATGAPPVAGPAASPPAAPVNLNSATLEELATLDGVGPVMAQKIVDYRQQHGGFASVDELDAIPGIGPKRLESLREQVTA
jgi:competence protein ComEA